MNRKQNQNNFSFVLTGLNGLKARRLFLLLLFIPYAFFLLPLLYSDDQIKLENEVKFSESTAALSPKLWISLPNGVIDITAKARVSRSDTIFKIKYDFFAGYVQSKIDFNMWFRTSFFGIELSDRVDFDQLIINKRYIRRTTYFMPHYDYMLSKNFRYRTFVSFGKSYSANIEDVAQVDKGSDVRGGLAIIFDSLIDTPEISKGIRSTLELTGPVAFLPTDYSYVLAEMNLNKMWNLGKKNKLKLNFKMGYPVSTLRKPLGAFYYLGGYDILRGYRYNEFAGDSIMYGVATCQFPFKGFYLKRHLEIKTGDIGFEFGKVGDKNIFGTLNDFRSSVYTGITFTLTIWRLRFELNTIIGQAVDARKPEGIYNINSIVYVVDIEPEIEK